MQISIMLHGDKINSAKHTKIQYIHQKFINSKYIKFCRMFKLMQYLYQQLLLYQ